VRKKQTQNAQGKNLSNGSLLRPPDITIRKIMPRPDIPLQEVSSHIRARKGKILGREGKKGGGKKTVFIVKKSALAGKEKGKRLKRLGEKKDSRRWGMGAAKSENRNIGKMTKRGDLLQTVNAKKTSLMTLGKEGESYLKEEQEQRISAKRRLVMLACNLKSPERTWRAKDGEVKGRTA